MSAESGLRLGLTTDEAATAFGMTARGWRKLVAEGRAPAPFYVGRLPRWSPEELAAWRDAGAPDRLVWEAMRNEAKPPCAALSPKGRI
jgi:hypothetical protein